MSGFPFLAPAVRNIFSHVRTRLLCPTLWKIAFVLDAMFSINAPCCCDTASPLRCSPLIDLDDCCAGRPNSELHRPPLQLRKLRFLPNLDQRVLVYVQVAAPDPVILRTHLP
jgi:hypothetical protein